MNILQKIFAFGKHQQKKANRGEIVILYLCDQKKCIRCSYPLCQHTADIRHAANFKRSGFGRNVFSEQ